MAAQDLDWFLEEENEEAFATLTPEQVATLTSGGTVEFGDTEAAKADEESSGSPAAAVDTNEDPVVLTKDGKHTIPFEEHRAAKDRAQQAESRAVELETLAKEQAELIESLKAAKVSDKGTGDTANQDEVLAQFKDAYPELAETLAPLLQKIATAGNNASVEALQREIADLKASIAPIKQAAVDSTTESHFSAIEKAHPDFESLIDSGDVEKWINESLPSYAKSGAMAVLEKGTADEVIELFGQFKQATGRAAETSKVDIKAAAEKAIANAKTRTPVTLNDIPAAGTTSNDEDPTTPAGWHNRFAKMTEAQILAELAR